MEPISVCRKVAFVTELRAHTHTLFPLTRAETNVVPLRDEPYCGARGARLQALRVYCSRPGNNNWLLFITPPVERTNAAFETRISRSRFAFSSREKAVTGGSSRFSFSKKFSQRGELLQLAKRWTEKNVKHYQTCHTISKCCVCRAVRANMFVRRIKRGQNVIIIIIIFLIAHPPYINRTAPRATRLRS